MDRNQLLMLLIQQARKNGFEFRKWFRSHTARPWVSPEDAVQWLGQGARAQMLLFSHSFARSFFGNGKRFRYIQPTVSYTRVLPNGGTRTVTRRAHMRQSSHDEVWLYHLQAMAAEAEPLRYLRRFLVLEETLQEAETGGSAAGLFVQARPGDDLMNYDDESLVRQ